MAIRDDETETRHANVYFGGKLYIHHLGRVRWLDTVRRETDVPYVPQPAGDVSHTRA